MLSGSRTIIINLASTGLGPVKKYLGTMREWGLVFGESAINMGYREAGMTRSLLSLDGSEDERKVENQGSLRQFGQSFKLCDMYLIN